MHLLYIRLFLCVFCCVVFVPVAMASDPMGDLPIQARLPNSLKPLGLKVGVFTLYPSLRQDVGYTDNVYQVKSGRKSDKFYSVRPSLMMKGAMHGHDLALSAHAERIMYQEYDAQGYTNFKLGLSDEVTLDSTTSLNVGAQFDRHHETRIDLDGTEPAFSEPVRSDTRHIFAKMKFKPARLGWTIGADYKAIGYSNTKSLSGDQTIIQDDRNRIEARLSADVVYDSQRRIQPFFGLSYEHVDYAKRDYVDGAGYIGVDQDRNRVEGLAGFILKPIGKWSSSAKVGYGYEMTKDDALDNQGSGLVDIDLTYLYTPLTNFMFGFERFFSDDTPSTRGIVETRLSTSVIHELTRQWILTAGVRWAHRDFDQGSQDNTITGILSAGYKMNRHFRLTGDIEHIDRESNRANGDFSETKAVISLKSSF